MGISRLRRVGMFHLVLIGVMLVAGLLLAWDTTEAQTPPTLNFACQASTGYLMAANHGSSCPAGQKHVDFRTGKPAEPVCASNTLSNMRVVGSTAACTLLETPRILHGTSQTFVCSVPASTPTLGGSLRLALPNSTCRSGETRWVIPPGPTVAVDDSYFAGFETPLTVPPLGVLANDPTANGGTITSYDTTTVNGGSVTLNPNGGFTYTPPTGFTGTDSFTYTLTSPGGSDTATVTIQVIHFPIAVDDTFDPQSGFTSTIPTPDVLANDTPNGATPRVSSPIAFNVPVDADTGLSVRLTYRLTGADATTSSTATFALGSDPCATKLREGVYLIALPDANAALPSSSRFSAAGVGAGDRGRRMLHHHDWYGGQARPSSQPHIMLSIEWAGHASTFGMLDRATSRFCFRYTRARALRNSRLPAGLLRRSTRSSLSSSLPSTPITRNTTPTRSSPSSWTTIHRFGPGPLHLESVTDMCRERRGGKCLQHRWRVHSP